MAKIKLILKILQRVVIFIASLTLFVLALVMMKEGARPLGSLIRDTFSVDSVASALGFGWLAASLVLGGSPVAATALSLLDAQVLNPLETFAMISGSRLGASMVVLMVGFLYVLRGKQRNVSLGVGLTSLLVTQTLYPLVLILGFFLLSQTWFTGWSLTVTQELNSPFDLLLAPLVEWLKMNIAPGVLLPAGFGLTVFSLWLFDQAIPDLNLQKSEVGQMYQLVYRPLVIFLVGALITSVTMSVAVSLSLLVPLSVRGFVRLENVIPYIMGANITTFMDTLIAAALLANPMGVTVVAVQIVSVLIGSLLLLGIRFRSYERMIQRLVQWIGSRRRYLAFYLFLIFGIPILLLWIG